MQHIRGLTVEERENGECIRSRDLVLELDDEKLYG
jgi:hypothetical protein